MTDRLAQMRARLDMVQMEAAEQAASRAARNNRLGYFSPKPRQGFGPKYMVRLLEPAYIAELGIFPILSLLEYGNKVLGKYQGYLAPFQFGMPDPIKERRDAILAIPSDRRSAIEADFLKNWYPKQTHFGLIWDMGAKEMEPLLWQFSTRTFSSLANQLGSTVRETWAADSYQGSKIELIREGSDQDTNYTFSISPKAEPLPPALIQRIDTLDFAKVIRVETAETLRGIIDHHHYDFREAGDARNLRDADPKTAFPGLLLPEGKPNHNHPIVMNYLAKTAHAEAQASAPSAPPVSLPASPRVAVAMPAPALPKPAPAPSYAPPPVIPQVPALANDAPDDDLPFDQRNGHAAPVARLTWAEAEAKYVGKLIRFADGERQLAAHCVALANDTQGSEPFVLTVKVFESNGQPMEPFGMEMEVEEGWIDAVELMPPAPVASQPVQAPEPVASPPAAVIPMTSAPAAPEAPAAPAKKLGIKERMAQSRAAKA